MDPHPVIVTITDKGDYIRSSYSHYSTIRRLGVHLKQRARIGQDTLRRHWCHEFQPRPQQYSSSCRSISRTEKVRLDFREIRLYYQRPRIVECFLKVPYVALYIPYIYVYLFIPMNLVLPRSCIAQWSRLFWPLAL